MIINWGLPQNAGGHFIQDKGQERSEWALNECQGAVLARYAGKEALTLLKQTAANAAVGLGVLGFLFFAAEATEAVVGGATALDWVVSAFVKLDSAAWAATFAEAAVITAVKTYGKLVKESFGNKKEAWTELRNCARDHAPLDGPFGWLMNPKRNPFAPR